MAIKVVECLEWPAKDRPGELFKIAQHFKKQKVNLDGLWAYHSSGQARMAAVGKKPEALRAALSKAGLSGESSPCIYISGADKAGATVDALAKLARARVNVECFEAQAAGGKFGAAIWVRAADLPKAKKALKLK